MRERRGRIEVICGSMFSGKSEELLRRVRRAEIARQRVQVFIPALDTRYGTGTVNSHDGRAKEALVVSTSDEIDSQIRPDTTVVAIDEAQFFDLGLIRLCRDLAVGGVRVIVAGLDKDFRGEPFGPMPGLMVEAEDVEKLHAICIVCGEDATHTQRLVNGQPASYDDPVIMIGAHERYEARCRQCHRVPGHPDHIPTKEHSHGGAAR